MTSHAAVGVDDDLASGEPGVAHGAADDKASRGIDVVLRIFIEQVRRNHGLNHVLQNARAQFVVARRLGMLRRNDDSIHAKNFALRIIFNCDLGFSIRPKEGKRAILANLREPHGQLVRERDRRRHQLLILVDRIPKHHSLVAGAAGVYAHGDVAGLLVDAGDDGAGVAVEAVEGVVVSDGGDGAADDGLEIDVGFGGDFSGDDDEAGGGKGFAGDAAGGIFGEAGVEDGVGNLVGDLIGMAFGHGFRGE